VLGNSFGVDPAIHWFGRKKNEFNPANVNISSQSQTHLETKQVLPSFSTV
jgi:hypothetical protein